MDPDDRRAAALCPVFVKLANLGSSVGITKANNREELEATLRPDGGYDRKIVVERGIEGREFECSVLGSEPRRVAVPCEIFRRREFYDYEESICSTRRIPSARAAHAGGDGGNAGLAVGAKAVGCEGMARVDFLMEAAPGGCISTRSIPFPASLPSACTRRCGSAAACLLPASSTA